MTLAIAWFRRDLRLHDNPAWANATRSHRHILPVFVIDPHLMDRAGAFRREAMLDGVGGLDAALIQLGGRLHIVTGDPVDVIPNLAHATGAAAVYINADVTPYATARDDAVRHALGGLGVEPIATWGSLIRPPGSILTDQGSVPKVFSAFWRRWQQESLPSEVSPAPTKIAVRDGGERLEPRPSGGGERSAATLLDDFVEHRLTRYLEDRDLPAIVGTSQLSVALKVGTIGPATAARAASTSGHGDPFVRQLAWRDWFAHLLYEEPRLVFSPQRADRSPEWRDDPDEFAAWKAGRTGFPIVDAGMRELAATGRMHNRVRMITASFLVKDLLVDWRRGERYFRHHLADGDVAQNVGNWQWVAGTGPDAAPFFRVFNPTLQSERFDAPGVYLRRWLPELASLDDSSIHAPTRLGPLDLAAMGITMGVDYPFPIVDHALARHRAIKAYGR